MMLRYPVDLAPDDNDTVMVTCPLLPMMITYGETREAALHHAADAIETVLASMMDDDEAIPLPQITTERDSVRVPVETELKVRLHSSLREAGLTRDDLGRRLVWSRAAVDRLFDIGHVAPIEQLDRAFAVLGKVVAIEIREAA